MKIYHWIGLALLTIVGCFIASFYVLVCGMFMVTSEGTWMIAVPIIIIGLNVLSIPIYINVLKKGWRYLYNFSITILTAFICFYGAIEWAESIHGLRGSMQLLLETALGVGIAVIGILISLAFSRRKTEKSQIT